MMLDLLYSIAMKKSMMLYLTSRQTSLQKSHPASSAHCVHKNCEYNVLEVLVTATILQNLNREKIIEKSTIRSVD